MDFYVVYLWYFKNISKVLTYGMQGKKYAWKNWREFFTFILKTMCLDKVFLYTFQLVKFCLKKACLYSSPAQLFFIYTGWKAKLEAIPKKKYFNVLLSCQRHNVLLHIRMLCIVQTNVIGQMNIFVCKTKHIQEAVC